MASQRQKYLLMSNRVGKRIEKGLITSKKLQVQLLRGEILEALPKSEQPKEPYKIALTGLAASNIKLECPILDVSRLSAVEYGLLSAVSSLGERFRIYEDRKRIELAKSLDVGSFVSLKLNYDYCEYKGIIRYKGSLPTCRGTRFGVELLDEEAKGHGTSDGTFKNIRYFVCPEKCGVFVAVDKLQSWREQANASNSDVPNGIVLRRSAELEMSLASEKKKHEETKMRLQSSEQRSQQLEISLSQVRQAYEKTEKRLQISEQRSQELETSLSQVRQAYEETEKRLQSSQERSQELETSLSQARKAHEETEKRLEQRSQELERRLQMSDQTSNRLEASLLEERQRPNELESTMTSVRQAFDDRRSKELVQIDWVLLRDEISVAGNTIGVGAWATVKEGTFRGSKYAVKEMHQLILSPHNKRLFEQEMSMASRCRHACLLHFIAATHTDQSPLFVTELLDTSLRAALHERSLQPTEITTIALDVAKGLNYLHLNQPAPIIHRDISSANVLLRKLGTSWRAKLSDYETADILTHSTTVSPGAVVYSAPEAQTFRQTPKVDVYSFGVLLCEMNVREMPDVQHREEQVAMVTNTFFRNLIRRCLQQRREESPSVAEILIGELRNSQ